MPRVKPRTQTRLPDRPGRWKLLLRRQRRLLRPALAAGALAAGCGGLLLAVHQLGHGESFRERLGHATARLGLRVQDVIVEGRQKTPEPLLRAALGVSRGDPILGFSLTEARARIESINWVQSATVERQLPGTVVVQLNERRPFAVWQHNGKFVLVDREGDMVTNSDVAAFANQLPLVVGAGAPAAAAALVDALSAQPSIMTRVMAAVRVGERRWNLHMNNGTDVLLPEGAEGAALAKLAELQSSLSLLDRPLQTVDLRLPDRLSIRLRQDKQDDSNNKDAARGTQPPPAPPRRPT